MLLAFSFPDFLMKTKTQRKWRNLLLNTRFQGRLTLFVLLAGIACAGLNAYLYYIYVVESYGFIFRYSKLPKDLIDARYSDLLTFGIALGAITLVVLLLIALWVLIMTHRAAGSVYKIKKVTEEITAGNLHARVRLREKDDFHDLADSFNEMMNAIENQMAGKR